MYDLAAFIISIGTLTWTIYRDCVDKPKLKVKIDIMTLSKDLSKIIFIRITNIGKKPIVLDVYGFRKYDGTSIVFPDNRVCKKLESYGVLKIDLGRDDLVSLSAQANQLKDFIVCDTIGKEWYADRKCMNEFLNDLAKLKV